MATIGSIYNNGAANIGGLLSKVKEYYFSMSVDTITNALRNAGLPNGAKITNIEIEPHIEIENTAAGNFFFSYGFGSNGSSIGTTLVNSAKITNVAMNGSIKPKANITSYMSSVQAPYACSTAYGSYLNFKVHADTVGKRSYWLHSVYLYVTYEIWHTATFKNGETTLQVISVLEGSIPSYSGATPTKAQDDKYTYSFSGWKDANGNSLGAITADTTYTAQFTPVLKEYEVIVICSESVSGETCNATGGGIYHFGDTVTLRAIDIPQYHEFNGWTIHTESSSYNGNTNPFTFTVSGSTTVYCVINHTGYTIKANILPNDDAGVVEGGLIYDGLWFKMDLISDEGWNVPYERSKVAINAVPNKGYKFVKWSDGVTANPRSLMPTGDATYTACFELDRINLILVDTAQSLGVLVDADIKDDDEVYVDLIKVYG